MKLPVKFRHTSLLTKVIVTIVSVACVILMVSQQSQRRANQQKMQELEKVVAELREENQDLVADIDGLGSDESVEKIARDKLGLVSGGEVIFSDVGD